jgi:cytochrome c-type biogenesis protein CcmH
MTIFLFCAGLLLALGVAFLLRPLLRTAAATGGRDRTMVSVYRDQLRELNADRASGAITEEQFNSGRSELERRVLDEIAQPAAVSGVSRKTGLTAVTIGAFVVVVPVALYLALGRPDAIGPASAESQATAEQGQAGTGDKAAPHAITPAQVQAMIDKLAKALQQNPGDGDGWAMLARSYAYIRNFPESVKAFEKATQLLPNDARLLADYADALAMTQERHLAGAPMKLVQRALAIDPKDVKALALAGSEAFDRKDYPAAVSYWDRAVKAGPPDPEFAKQLEAGLMEARQLAGGAAPQQEASPPPAAAQAARPPAGSARAAAAVPSGGTVKGRVELAASLAGKAAPGDTVFVFARAAQGPRMPLALMKRTVKDLPLEFALDDTMAMMPDLKLSNFSSVVIGARVSKAGDAMPASGDLQGFSQPVKVGSAGVDVRIDQVVP